MRVRIPVEHDGAHIGGGMPSTLPPRLTLLYPHPISDDFASSLAGVPKSIREAGGDYQKRGTFAERLQRAHPGVHKRYYG